MQTFSSTDCSPSRAEYDGPQLPRHGYAYVDRQTLQVALVTGGGSGIGLMAAQALAVNGARVYIVGRTEKKLKAATEAHGKNIPGEIIPLVGDVSDKKDIK